MNLAVVLVEPKYGGNVGSIARVMKNFGFKELIIVGEFVPDAQTKQMACHAWDIIENAKKLRSIEELKENFDLIVATTGIRTKSEKRFRRMWISPRDLPRIIRGRKTAILFGREDYGLYDREIEFSHIVVSVPTSDDYPVMNISHAAAVILYELYLHQSVDECVHTFADASEIELLYERISELLRVLKYPSHKIINTELMIRRILGRLALSKWEYHSLMGIINKIIVKIDENRNNMLFDDSDTESFS